MICEKKETNNVAETLITTHKEEIPRSDIIIFIARMINISQYNQTFSKIILISFK